MTGQQYYELDRKQCPIRSDGTVRPEWDNLKQKDKDAWDRIVVLRKLEETP